MTYGASAGRRDGNGVLVTGATGFVGREVLSRYLERTDRTVYALVRADDAAAADQRLRDGLRTATGTDVGESERLVAVAGDVQEPDLGLDAAVRDRLAEDVSDVIHSAASVSFALPLDESRAINVEGTRNIVTFAERCASSGGLHRLCYVSTAYVAGTHAGEFGEDDFDVGQDFRNAYEESKFEAERLVRSHEDRLPVQIVRPSIVVGERRSGWTGSFNVLYAPLKVFVRGRLPALPARPRAPVDVVPVDYVANAIFELSSGDGAADNRTWHLVAGRDATTVERLVGLAAERIDRRAPRLLRPGPYRRLLHPLLVRTGSERRKRGLRQMEVFFPYLAMRVRYSDGATRRRLGRVGIAPGNVESYFERLIGFAQRAGWGKETISREQARQA
jgi:thioester reductase-like protein